MTQSTAHCRPSRRREVSGEFRTQELPCDIVELVSGEGEVV
ncbi:hypothetical protein MYVA_1191 [Mycolicibacterium vaccae 95051]|nr:hypothetical protein MYVA_1191 [Mycolicibacterium vaccae 95051]